MAAEMLAGGVAESIVGECVGHYRVLSRIGRGGMGEVYLAEDTRLGRKVALKLLSGDVIADGESRRRFALEAKAASSLNHPNIITVYDIGSHGDRDFIAMEYVEGESLRGLILHGKIEVKRAFELAAQVAGGLAAAHDAGIIHRDIKPENLMVTRTSQVKILDFGLAKLVERQRASIVSRDLSAVLQVQHGVGPETVPGTILGTVSYMSPEQAEGRAVDHRTDIFSLGAVLYELLTGKRPFEAKSAIDTLHAIINQEPRPALELNPRLPPQSAEILGKAMAKDERERYRHPGDFELDLRRLKRAMESQSVASTEARTLPRGASKERARWTSVLSRLIPASIGAFIALGVALGVWIITKPVAVAPRAVWPERITLTPLTTDPGFEGDPTFSPDGQTIAYSSDRTGNFEIFLKDVSGGQDIKSHQ